jgi:AraC-like DNA-binding protein
MLKPAENLRHLQFEPIIVDPRASFFIGRYDRTHFAFYWHYHPEIEIGLVMKGQGLRFVGDSIETFHDGDLCLFASNLPHTWVSSPVPRKRQHSMCVRFLPDCLGPDFFTRPEMQPIRRLFERARRGLCFHGRTQAAVAERLIAMSERHVGHWRQIGDLIWILGTLAESREFSSLAAGEMTQGQRKSTDRRLALILEFMNADPDVIPSQEMAARHARLSAQAFSRFFKRGIGKTYVQYRNELRVGRACRLLLDTEESITQTALLSGFHNLSNFNEQFLGIKGVTPRAYRKAGITEIGLGNR